MSWIAALNNWRTPPHTPRTLVWLGDTDDKRFAKDAAGCVMYFSTEKECLEFMEWLSKEDDRRSKRNAS